MYINVAGPQKYAIKIDVELVETNLVPPNDLLLLFDMICHFCYVASCFNDFYSNVPALHRHLIELNIAGWAKQDGEQVDG